MAYKKSSRDNTNLFGTFLSNVSSDDSSMYSEAAKTGGAAQAATPPDQAPTIDSSAVALLIYLLENGSTMAGPMLSGTGMALEDFFVATRALQAHGYIASTMDQAGEHFSLTEAGKIEAERWKSTLSFMTGK